MRRRRSPPAATKVAIRSTRHQGAQRIWIALGQPRRRRTGLELLGGPQGALDMSAPQHHRGRIGRARDIVRDGGRRPMRQAGPAIQTPQRVHPGRQPQPQERQGGDRRQHEEQAEPDGPTHRRQPQPQAEPRRRQEQPHSGRRRRQRRPQALPQDGQAGALERAGEHGIAVVSIRAGSVRNWLARHGAFLGTLVQAHLLKLESAVFRILTRYRTRTTRQIKGTSIKTRAWPTGSQCMTGFHCQGGKRSSPIKASASRRGRTNAHSPCRTSTSGTKGRVL